VKHEGPLDPPGVAQVLAKVAAQEKPDLFVLGKQSIDDDQNQVGQMVSEILGWSLATFASKVESLESEQEKNKVPAIAIDGTKARVIREVDGGLETLELSLPGVVTTDLRLNQPRYASLPGIMKAKKKPVAETTPQALGADVAVKVKVLKHAAPPARKAGIKVPDVATLLDKLRNEAKAI
jgi:electron transfer flavoprotein beta subunit